MDGGSRVLSEVTGSVDCAELVDRDFNRGVRWVWCLGFVVGCCLGDPFVCTWGGGTKFHGTVADFLVFSAFCWT